jgi:hypothetical protein
LAPRARINGGVYQFNIPRAEAITDDGIAFQSHGTAIAINFQPTGGGKRHYWRFRACRKGSDPVLKELLERYRR